jgi:hypothetical protein
VTLTMLTIEFSQVAFGGNLDGLKLYEPAKPIE